MFQAMMTIMISKWELFKSKDLVRTHLNEMRIVPLTIITKFHFIHTYPISEFDVFRSVVIVAA